jgi:DNA-binding transcriptional regulator GbsR (MarR family)
VTDDANKAAERLALFFMQFGLQRMVARVWAAVLFAEEETITAGEIAERLGVSAGAVSGAVKTLMTTGMIERVPVPGSRRDHYAFPPGSWGDLVGRMSESFDRTREMAQEGIDAVGEGSLPGQRLAEMRDFYAYIGREMPALLQHWKEQRAAAD